ncbi:glycosyltransferase family 4 protein [Oleiagrimonas sp. C23AA]|uniref:glycosyltransferase family 4 protein n=1 Tax=Oleiagrimonas sp. C23AA TaxID=2719047 RepID=UPI00141ED689|nr:glycosyltransferase family 4 protein [Oleiagrimonas sp. C23AA]NII11159.1 glycosyltransferase family 4 protein [Oleiagrimonas sp. C23AA]
MSKTVIMIGFHFPPSAMSSGHLRLLAFTRYLPACGWDPVVLSAVPMAYESVDPASVEVIPDPCRVHRSFALDAKRHMAVMGRYPSMLALPDRWASWWPAAVWSGLRLIRRHRPQAIWSTFPIMTSHCVAYALHRLSGLPWVADFRDPVSSSTAGKHAQAVRSQERWERRVLGHAARSVFTTPGAMRRCAERFPEASQEGRLAVVANGYDEDAFVGLLARSARAGGPLVLVHSGLLYPEGRSPVPFFAALARLRESGYLVPGALKVILRASGSESVYAREIQRHGLDDTVILAPQVSNSEALREQAEADGLLLFQGSKFDLQIPAKAYEYLRIGRPILALVGAGGDTACLLRQSGGAVLVPADDVDAIAVGLQDFLRALQQGTTSSPNQDAVAGYSRRAGAAKLASLLDEVSR